MVHSSMKTVSVGLQPQPVIVRIQAPLYLIRGCKKAYRRSLKESSNRSSYIVTRAIDGENNGTESYGSLEYDSWCAMPFVTVDNTKDPDFTILEIEILDYAGLLRVIAWCLNGLDIVTENALLSTSPDGVANNSFWLRTSSGKKLTDKAAQILVERIRDYLAYCSPKPDEELQTEFQSGPISLSNTEHPEYTVVKVAESKRTPGQMLTIASILSGLNVRVMEGVIQGSSWKPSEEAFSSDVSRLFTFCILDQNGRKLDVASAKSLLYTLGVGLGFSSQTYPLRPPNLDISTS